MEKLDIDKVKKLISEEIDSLEARIMASVVNTFDQWENRQELRHSENRTRTQYLDVKVAEVKSQGEGIIKSQQVLQDTLNSTQVLVKELLTKVVHEEGLKLGIRTSEENHQKKEDRRKNWIIALLAAMPIGATIKYLASIFHINVGGK